jgi:hypothetical protein
MRKKEKKKKRKTKNRSGKEAALLVSSDYH